VRDADSRSAHRREEDTFLNIFAFNARSIVNKADCLNVYYDSYAPHVFAISETWLDPSMPNETLGEILTKFNVVRCDRKDGRRGRGVCFLIRKGVNFTELEKPANDCDSLWLDICLEIRIRIGLFYHPPNAPRSVFDSMISEIQVMVEEANDMPCVLVGDFNITGIDWTVPRTLSNDAIACSFMECVNQCQLKQEVFEGTRGGQILDLVLCKPENIVRSLEVLPPLRSDHSSISIQLRTKATAKGDTPRRNFRSGNYKEIREFLDNLNWHHLSEMCDSATDFWKVIHQTLIFCIEEFIPMTTVKKLLRSKGQANRKTKMRRLQRMFKRFRENGISGLNNPDLEALAEQIEGDAKKERWEAESKILRQKNTAKFYGYVNNKLHSHSDIPALKTDGELLTSDSSKAAAFSDFFSEVFTKDNGELPEVSSCGNIISSVMFDPVNVLTAIRELKSNYSAGGDELPPIFIKMIGTQLCDPLSTLFNRCLMEGVLPADWKEAIVIPLFKKGRKFLVENYRPISLTSVISKIMERVIRKILVGFLEENLLLSNAQHGFRSKRSTTSALLSSLFEWLSAVDRGDITDVVYLDFRKAFDSVVHSKLLRKLEAIGIRGNLLKFCENFLLNRTQTVRVGNSLSQSAPVVSGVPQGTVLGLLFFIVYINDMLCNDIIDPCSIHAYADDGKIGNSSARAIYDPNTLQCCLDRVSDWARSWQMGLAGEKCKVMRFGSTSFENLPEYQVGGMPLEYVSEMRDLGILVCSNMKFSGHVESIVAKAYARIDLIFRAFLSRDLKFLSSMYTVYVRPMLESNTVIFSPGHKFLIDRIESVQRYFTRRAMGYPAGRMLRRAPAPDELDYFSRLEMFSLEPLELRRIKFDLLQMFKMKLGGLCSIKFEEFFKLGCQRTRGHSAKLEVPLAHRDVMKFFFSHRAVEYWNGLSEETVGKATLSGFKTALVNEPLCRYLKGRYTAASAD
jgi:hypothetical protein